MCALNRKEFRKKNCFLIRHFPSEPKCTARAAGWRWGGWSSSWAEFLGAFHPWRHIPGREAPAPPASTVPECTDFRLARRHRHIPKLQGDPWQQHRRIHLWQELPAPCPWAGKCCGTGAVNCCSCELGHKHWVLSIWGSCHPHFAQAEAVNEAEGQFRRDNL